MGDPRALGTDATTPAGVETGASEASTHAPRKLAGRYEILGLLGAGGMGSVYRARDTALGELVALKILKKELVAVPGMLERFRQEVKLARRVTHPNVARTFDIGSDEGDCFLTMELVDGAPLSADLARHGRLTMTALVALARPICAGLAAAHAAGVLHRDLKPENVLVGRDGRVVITDFGVARGLEPADAGRTFGGVVGTPAYMAPEQVEGRRDLDARCDVYALGAMLFELATGRQAWSGESAVSVAAARLLQPPPDPRAFAPEMPEAAAAVILRCMARDRDARYASADEVAQALSGFGAPTGAIAAAPAPRPTILPQDDGLDESGRKTLAVLPIANLGAEEDAYLADALSDDVIDLLSTARGLRVRPRSVAARFAGRGVDPREAGRALGVQVVVEGSVRRIGALLRIQVRVVTVADGFQLWGKRFDRAPAEFLSVGDDVASAICEVLSIDARAPARAAPTDATALDLYMRGRHQLHRAWFSANAGAVELLEQAYRRAPKDARIVASYALALVQKFSYMEAPGLDDEALARVEEALALDPDLAEARVALAMLHIHRGETVTGARQLRLALSRAPAVPAGLDWKGRLLIESGDPREGIALLERALELEPQLGHVRSSVARTLALLGDWAASDEMLSEIPANPHDATLTWMTRSRLVMWRQDPALSRALEEEFLARGTMVAEPHRTSIRYMARAVARDASTEEVLAEFGRTLPQTARVPRRGMFFAQIRTEVLSTVGDLARAKQMLHDADGYGLNDVLWFERCPLLTPLKEDPEVRSIGARVAGRAARIVEALEGR